MFESVLMRWMNLEPIIQSEVSQKEKDKYHILTHIYEVQKDGTDEFTCKAAMERNRHREQTYGHGERGREGEINGESNIDTCYGNLLQSQETQAGALYQPRGVEWGGKREGGSTGRGHYMSTYG